MEQQLWDELSKQLWGELSNGLKEFMESTGFTTVVIGESGGLDSALVTVLAVDTLGAENVTALTMPSEFTTEETLRDALELCDNLGVAIHTLPISDLVDTFLETIDLTGVAHENLQARIRGVLLMGWANQHDSIVLCPSNKSEAAMGYSTLYGDTVGSYAPLWDVYKTELFRLAKWYAAKNPGVIPETTLTRPPTAELAHGQKDEDSLPPYPLLDAILESYVEGEIPESWIIATFGKTGEDTIARLRRSAWKRKQEPRGVKVSTRTLEELDRSTEK